MIVKFLSVASRVGGSNHLDPSSRTCWPVENGVIRINEWLVDSGARANKLLGETHASPM